MKKLVLAGLLITVVFLSAACLPLMLLSAYNQGSEETGETAPLDVPKDFDQKYEALSWLKDSNSEAALAGNRFEDTTEAIRFVEDLYAAGAVNVWVTGVGTENEMDGPYADALIVKMPLDEVKQKKILGIYFREVQIYGCNFGEESQGYDSGDMVYFWWD